MKTLNFIFKIALLVFSIGLLYGYIIMITMLSVDPSIVEYLCGGLFNTSHNLGNIGYLLSLPLFPGVGTKSLNTVYPKDVNECNAIIAKAINSYTPIINSGSKKDFCQVANGVFQSEGTVSAKIRKDKLSVTPVVALGQNLSKGTIDFFVRLYFELGKRGRIFATSTLSGKIHIKYTCESWKDIGFLSEYFSFLYGEKYIAFKKLAEIFILKSKTDDRSKIDLIRLVYSLAASGKERKIKLEDLLVKFGLSLVNSSLIEKSKIYTDNPNIPTFLFLLGFILGDGSIFIRIRLGSSDSITFVPLLIFPQKADKSNEHMFKMFMAFFKNIGINTIYAHNKSGVSTLTVEGVKAINTLIPLFKASLSLGYWRTDLIEILIKYFKLHSAGAHTYRKGLIAILTLVLNYDHGRIKSLEEWIIIANSYFNKLEAECTSGYQFIQPVNGRGDLASQQIAWRVVLSNKIIPKHPIKQFSFSSYNSTEQALVAALSYRDYILDNHLKDLTD